MPYSPEVLVVKSNIDEWMLRNENTKLEGQERTNFKLQLQKAYQDSGKEKTWAQIECSIHTILRQRPVFCNENTNVGLLKRPNGSLGSEAYAQAYRDGHAEESKAYKEEHKEELKASHKAYREEHTEEIKAHNAKNLDKLQKQRFAENKQFISDHPILRQKVHLLPVAISEILNAILMKLRP